MNNIIKKKSSKNVFKYNIYASNFMFYSSDNEKIIKKKKKLLTKLSNSLLDNQWIRIKGSNSNSNCNIDTNKLIKKNLHIDYKPNGIYFSKGEWLFHIIGCTWNDYISLVEVDYSKIYKITNRKPNNYKIDTYYKNKLRRFHNNYIDLNYKYPLINWKDIYQNYNGFAIYPYPYYANNFKDYFYLNLYDVATLVIWNTNSIIKEYNLTKIEWEDNKNKSNINHIIIDNTKFINSLIKKINLINSNKIN